MMAEPTGEKWVRFRIGSAFLAGSILARWIAGLSIIANDLTLTNVALLASSDPSKRLFYFWLVCAQFREAAKFLQSGTQLREVSDFIATLPEEARHQWELVQRSYDPWEGSFVQRVMKPLRDRLFHYPAPTASEWEPVINRIASKEIESGIRILGEEKVRNMRFVFADEIRTALLGEYLGANEEEIAQSMRKLRDLILALADFAYESLVVYLEQLPPGTVHTEER